MKRCVIFTLLALLFSVGSPGAKDWESINLPNLPGERHGHSMVTLPSGEISVFGGRGGSQGDVKNDLFIYGNEGWQPVVAANQPPPARYNHTAWVQSSQMYIHGERGANGALDDMWRYDPVNKTWEEIQFVGARPPARHGHTVTPLSDGSRMVLGGTDNNNNVLNDFWRIYADETAERLDDLPHGYTDHIAQLTPDESALLVFGEPNILAYYEFATGMWGMAALGPPLKGYAASMSSQNKLGEPVLFIFGGEDASGNESKVVYEFNLATGELTQRTETMPQTVKDGAVGMLPPAEQDRVSQGILPDGILNPRQAAATGGSGIRAMFFGGISNGTVTNFTAKFEPPQPLPGDVDGNAIVDLSDAILSLQAFTGLKPDLVSMAGDVDGDGKIGVTEAIYILQKVAGMRAE